MTQHIHGYGSGDPGFHVRPCAQIRTFLVLPGEIDEMLQFAGRYVSLKGVQYVGSLTGDR